jgi:hypothetical protein
MDSSTRREALIRSFFFSEDRPSLDRITSTESKTFALGPDGESRRRAEGTIQKIKLEQEETLRKIQLELDETLRKIQLEKEETFRKIECPLFIGKTVPKRRRFSTEAELSAPKEKKVAHVGQKVFSSIEDRLSYMPQPEKAGESIKPLPTTDGKQRPDVSGLADDDVSLLVARIFDAEGKADALEKMRNELAPKGILTPLGDGLRNINPDVFEMVFGKSVPAPGLPEKKRKEVDAYTFEKEFIEDVKRSLEEIEGHQKFGPLPIGREHSLGFEMIQREVEKIWMCTHKSRDGASSVLQNVYEMLQDRFGDDAKKIGLFTLIGQKMSDFVEEGLIEPGF